MGIRKGKYNFLFAFTIVIIICTVVFSLVVFPETPASADDSYFENAVNESTTVIDDPTTDLDISNLKVQSFVSFNKAFDFSMNKLLKADAYTSRSTGSISANILGLKVKELVTTYKEVNRVKEEYYTSAKFVKSATASLGFNLSCLFYQNDNDFYYQTIKEANDPSELFATTLSNFLSKNYINPIYFLYGLSSTDVDFVGNTNISQSSEGYKLTFKIKSGNVFTTIWKTIKLICEGNYDKIACITPDCDTISYTMTLNKYGYITKINASTVVDVDPSQITTIAGAIGTQTINISVCELFNYKNSNLTVKSIL